MRFIKIITTILFIFLLFLPVSAETGEEIIVIDADTVWNSDLILASSDVIDSTDASPENLIKWAFVSHADSVWNAELEKNEWEIPEHNPKLLVSGQPTIIESEKTQLTYKINVTNNGNVKDTINLSVSHQSISEDKINWWNTILPASSVILEPNESVDILLEIIIEEDKPNTITITGISQGDNSKNSSCQIFIDEVLSTGFDMSKDSYSFPNWSWFDLPLIYRMKHCFGMSETSILYFKRGKLLNNKPNTYSLTKDEARWNIKAHQMRWPAIFSGGLIDGIEINEKKEYAKFEKSIKGKEEKSTPMIFALRPWHGFGGHAVAAYKIIKEKIVKEDSNSYYKSYILIYENENVYNPLSQLQYITYDSSLCKFNYPDYDRFKVIEAKELPKLKQFIFNVESPVNITVIDQFDRIVNNQGFNEIPEANFIGIGEKKFFYLPDNLTYSVEIKGYEEGEFTLTLISPLDENDVLITSFENVPVTPNTQANFTIQPGVTDYPMNIDYDGDGTVDETRDPDINEILSGGNPKLETQIAIIEMIYGGTNILNNVTQDVGDSVAPLLLAELKQSTVDLEDYTPDGKLNPGQKKKLKMKFKFLETAGNEYQGKSINVNFKFLAKQ